MTIGSRASKRPESTTSGSGCGPEAFGLEWDRVNKVRYHLDSAWQLDHVLAKAERRGIFVMLCLDYHGIFEIKPDYWGGNNFWTRHPYNATNGGPCQVQNDFFTNAEARKLYEKRLRYLVARWSAFPSILAWEFFNEIDNEYAYLKHADVVSWHRDMGRRLRAVDPYRHLISSSFTGGSERPDLYALPEMDFSQVPFLQRAAPGAGDGPAHRTLLPEISQALFRQRIRHRLARMEAGYRPAFPRPAPSHLERRLHRRRRHRHDLVVGEHPLRQPLPSLVGARRLPRRRRHRPPEMRPARFGKVEGAVTPFAIASPNQAMVWLLDQNSDWPDGAAAASPPPVTGAKVTLAGLEDGPWTVEWWDTLEGKRLAATDATVTGGSLLLEPPAFQADIAARLRRK